MLRRRRRQGSDVLGQRGEAKPGGSERAPVAGWRDEGDMVWRRTSEGSSCPWRCVWVAAVVGGREGASERREERGDLLSLV